MNKVNNLQDLLHYQLQTVYNAEIQLTKALPVFEESASNIELKKIFSLHITETKMHKERILGMAQDLNINLKGKTCSVMQKLIDQTNEFCNITGGQIMKDAGLIAYTQRIEHYEIASYSNLIQYAQSLDYNYLANFLQQSYSEETKTCNSLNALSLENFKKQTRNYFAA